LHTSREKTKLINRVRRIRGQMEAIERALEEQKGCADVLQLIAGVRGAINGLMAEVVEAHILLHVADHRSAPRHPKFSSTHVSYPTSCLLEFCYRISPIGLSVEPAPLAGAITQQISPTHSSFPASRSLR
jgi:DNA-binding FrmR family transcriptional regulator